MAIKQIEQDFVDEQGTNLNKYEMVDSNAMSTVVSLYRRASISQQGTPLNAEKFNGLIGEINDNFNDIQNQINQNTGNINNIVNAQVYTEYTHLQGLYLNHANPGGDPTKIVSNIPTGWTEVLAIIVPDEYKSTTNIETLVSVRERYIKLCGYVDINKSSALYANGLNNPSIQMQYESTNKYGLVAYKKSGSTNELGNILILKWYTTKY